jgi:hypothetical protein
VLISKFIQLKESFYADVGGKRKRRAENEHERKSKEVLMLVDTPFTDLIIHD